MREFVGRDFDLTLRGLTFGYFQFHIVEKLSYYHLIVNIRDILIEIVNLPRLRA